MPNSELLFKVVKRYGLLLAFCLGTAVMAFGQEPAPSTTTAGLLRVTVTDTQQRALSGATCSLFRANDASASVATATTDEQGIATLSPIVPGTYTLRVESQGFAPTSKTDLVITGTSTSEVTIALGVASVAEDVTVTAPTDTATGVEAGSSTPAGNLKHENLRRLPLPSARVDDALPLIPGVVRSSTGGISIKGASEQQSALVVNGLNADDPATGNFRLNLPIDSVEAVQVFQHPYTAEYGQFTGGLTSVETRRGGDRFHFEFNDFLPDPRIRQGKIRGIADDTPRFNINGPLIANRLYLSESLSYSYARTPVRGLQFPFDETTNQAASSFTQADLLLSSRHTQTYTFGFFPEHDNFVGLDYFQPQPITPNYKQRDYVFTFRDNYTLGGGLLQSAVSVKRFGANVYGQGTDEETFTPTVEQGNYFATQAQHSQRLEILELYTLPTQHFIYGSHDIKAGFDFNRVSNDLQYSARPVKITRADGTLAERIIFDQSPEIVGRNREYTGFIQDRWLARPDLSIDLGLRYEDQQIADETNLAPRAGFAWSPFAGERTVVRGGIGLFYDKVPLNICDFPSYPARTVVSYGLDGQTVIDRIHFVNILVDKAPVTPLDFNRSDDEAGFVPENLTWNIELDQAIKPWLSLRANVTGSQTDHIYILNPEPAFNGQSAIVLRSAGQATYRALELTARFRLPERNEIYVSYVRSQARGDLNDFNTYFGDFGAPIIRPNQYSNLPYDAPNRLIAWGTVALPRHFSIAPIFEVRSGFPYSVRDAEQNFIGVRNSDTTRFPRFLALDMEVAKEFQVTRKYGVRLSVRGFNLTNHFNPRDVRSNIADPGFGQFFASYRRFFTGGFDIIF